MDGTITGPAPLTMVRVKDSIRLRLEKMVDRYEEIGRSLADPAVIGRQREFRELSMEYARLTPVAEKFGAFSAMERELAAAHEMQGDSDPAMRGMGSEEAARLGPVIEQAEGDLKMLLIPRDPRDDKNIFLEVRAGTGGDEAAIFAGDLFRMYSRYAETHGFASKCCRRIPASMAASRRSSAASRAPRVLALKFESGVHRVQRVPATEAQGRIHTSAVTVAILARAGRSRRHRLNPSRIAHRYVSLVRRGGQHVNKTDSAVRITHLATRHRRRMPGRALAAQEPRARHGADEGAADVRPNRRNATAKSRSNRKLQVGTGDRSERIRTYNFPQGRVTDHRINLTLYKLGDVMQGKIDELLDALQHEHQAEQLAEEEQRGAA